MVSIYSVGFFRLVSFGFSEFVIEYYDGMDTKTVHMAQMCCIDYKRRLDDSTGCGIKAMDGMR